MMKKLLQIACLLAISKYSYSQTNTFPASGAVGIGTTTPKGTLDVSGSLVTFANIDPRFALGDLSFMPNTGTTVMGWNRSAGGGESSFVANQLDGSVGGFAFYNHNNTGQEQRLMWMLGNGNVVIGTGYLSNYRLSVDGNIHAKEVNVDLNNWPDYVFEPGYIRMPLSELETYILKNKHLPDMPSANEVQKQGVNLAEMNRLLVQKVEELTMHLIEQNKKIALQDQQSGELDKMKTMISVLEHHLNDISKKVRNSQ